MSYIVVDCESDGPILGLNSMVCFGAVIVRDGLEDTFYSGVLPPMSKVYNSEALAVSGITREEMENSKLNITKVMWDFHNWITDNSKGKPILISDNNGYDASWINYYFHMYSNYSNPFGWSSRRIGDMFAGFMNDPFYRWKKHRKTAHTHDPVDDAKGNAEALLYLRDQGFKIKLK